MMRLFLLALSLLLLVACGGDGGAGFKASISSPESGARLTEKQAVLFEGVVNNGINPLGAVQASWWSGQRVLCKWKTVGEDGSTSCESKLRVDEDSVLLFARIPGLAGLPDEEATDKIDVTVLAKAEAPRCSITSPDEDWGMEQSSSLEMKAKLELPSQDSQGERVSWTSDVDGALDESSVGEGGIASTTLSGLTEGLHRVRMIYEGGELGSCEDSIQLGVGPAPVVEIVSPEEPAQIVEGEAFSATATVEHKESVRLSWISDRDGVLKTRTIRSGGESRLSTKSLSAGLHQIRAVGTDSLGVPGSDSVEVSVEAIPTAPVIQLDPEQAFEADDLHVTILKSSEDPQGTETPTHRIEWRVDGNVVKQDVSMVPASATSVGELWEVLVWGETSTKTGHVARASILIDGFMGWGDQVNDFGIRDSQVRGEDEDDRAGTGLSAGCDLDGDGKDELLVGAPYNDEGGSNSGRTYVVRGADLTNNPLVDTYYLNESLVGQSSGDMSGSSIDCSGDIDGDGLLDIVVGSPGYDHSKGLTHLVLGSSFSGDFDLFSSDVFLAGENYGDLSGTRVQYAGDVDGDGLSDLLVGAWANDDRGTFSGKVYLLAGSSLSGGLASSLGDADASWIGEEAGHRAGHAVSRLGDVDGDGLDDIGFGAYGYDAKGVSSYLGSVYVAYSSSGLSTVDLGAEKADVVLHGESSKHYAGYDLSAHGDVDGDGLDDFLVSALGYESGTGGGGAVYMVLASDLQGGGTMSLSQASYVFEGEVVGDNTGRAINSAGDVDQDGVPDILIGSPSADNVAADGGQAYLFLDADIGGPGAYSLGQSSFIFTAVDDRELAGRQVVSGDFNGDGMSDLAVGGPDAGNTMKKRGHVYVMFAP